ncbi:MAG TPA: Clp protease N-terminal domain-containing protein [Actinospica sp.]|jgi:ATP-dependent Clp protease ATP-binding subunit ClpA|nr:Clp protease N-terminal domain-containing protein [Actinospica sp.]HWG28880.1 Clp protease N-terminal domain-containing protein [Actinospica sp.]
MTMFERFTGDARQAVALAQDEARQLCHNYIGTEHLLLGLLAENRGPAAQLLNERGLRAEDLRRRILVIVGGEGLDHEALATLGIDLDEVRRATEAAFGPGALDSTGRKPPTGHIPFTPRAKKVLELSVREAQRLQHGSIGTGHMLLGLILEGKGVAAKVLADIGCDLDALREDITRMIEPTNP